MLQGEGARRGDALHEHEEEAREGERDQIVQILDRHLGNSHARQALGKGAGEGDAVSARGHVGRGRDPEDDHREGRGAAREETLSQPEQEQGGDPHAQDPQVRVGDLGHQLPHPLEEVVPSSGDSQHFG